jgi:hypothetical protein
MFLVSFVLPCKLWDILIIFVKNTIWILTGIVLNICIAFSYLAVFTLLILPVHKCRRCFYFLMFSSVSFQS